jgi:rubredoxin---NAD+ reductase
MTQKPMLVIGSGLAGYMFSKEWRKYNTEQPLIIISRDDANFYSKPMLSNALAKGKTPSELITTPTETMQEQLQATILTNTTVESINPEAKTVTSDKGILEYDTLILATGAKPITPPLSGDVDALRQVNLLVDYSLFRETIADKKSVVILGSGLIGCEFANDLSAAGHQVKLISMEDTPLLRQVPAEIGNNLQEAFSQAGIEWHLGEIATSVSKTENGVTLAMKSGKTVSADCALCAIGIAPDLTLARNAGLKTKQGIVVNEFMQSSDPDIYAVGDCIEFDGRVEPFIAPLLLCARTLAKNLANPGTTTSISYPVMPVTIKTPLYPVVCAVPLTGTKGCWSCETVEDSTIARFIGTDGKLCGFAIGNATGKLRMQLTKEMNDAH